MSETAVPRPVAPAASGARILLTFRVLAALLSASSNLGSELRLRPWRHLLFQDAEAMLLAAKHRLESGLPEALGLDMIKLYRKLTRRRQDSNR
jgi:hypothetical protein